MLVEVGYAGLSIERVAAAAGVAKTTIYRRWPTKLKLCLDLLPRVLKALPIVEHGDARGDLRDFFVTVVQIATTDAGKVLPPLIAEAVHNVELRESFQQKYLHPRRQHALDMAQHAIDRGEIADDVDPSLFYDMLGGYIWFRRLVIGVPITAEEADAAVSALLDGTRARRKSTR